MSVETQSTAILNVIKRDGRVVAFDSNKIRTAINRSFLKGKFEGEVVVCPQTNEVAMLDGEPVDLNAITNQVVKLIYQAKQEYTGEDLWTPTIEYIQDVVVKVLKQSGYGKVASSYMNYRNHRTKVRESKTKLMKTLHEITYTDAKDSNLKRDNANIDGQTAMGSMLFYGAETAKDFNTKFFLTPEEAVAHQDGWIHIHKQNCGFMA